MIVKSAFTPAKGMSNAHLQSLWPSVLRYNLKMETRRERLELSDGDFLDLEWVGTGDGPIVVLFHGMAGNLESPYIKGMFQEVLRLGWRSVMMYYRGCSGEPNRLTKTYHLGQTEDVTELLQYLKKQYPLTPLYAVGFSMGGNILLKWLGDNPEQHFIQTAAAVSPPFDLRASSSSARKGHGRVYQWLLMRDLRKYVNKKYNYPNAPVDISKLPKIESFWDLDEKITAPINGFKNVTDYYHSSSCGKVLRHIKTPTLIIHAVDDPLIPASTIPTDEQLSEYVTLELSPTGGHVGFISGSFQKPVFWAEQRIIRFLHEYSTISRKNVPSEEALEWQEYS